MAARRLLTHVALLACLSAGCSDAESESAADATSPTSPSESSKESPDPTEPVDAERDPPAMPGGASKGTLKGAEAFVRHYIDLLNYAANTGDAKPLRAASARACGGCSDYAEAYSRTYARGGFIDTSGWKPTSVIPVRSQNVVVVLVDVQAPDITYSRRTNDPKKRGRGGLYKLRYELIKIHGDWRIRSFTEQGNG